METRKITLRDLLTVTGEEENIALYKACDEGKRFIVNIECESAKKYLNKDILDKEGIKTAGNTRQTKADHTKPKAAAVVT